LLEAAAELIVEHGYERTTLQAIGRKAGYSHGLVTGRFGSKEGLLTVLLDRMVVEWKEHELHDAIGEAVGADGIGIVINGVRESIAKSPSLMRALYVLMFEALLPVPILRDRMTELHRALRRDMTAMIEAGMAAGAVRSGIDPGAVAAMVVSALRGASYQWLLDPDDFDIDAQLRALDATARAHLRPVDDPAVEVSSGGMPTSPGR
jgi:AcrR family transcriptional regulator